MFGIMLGGVISVLVGIIVGFKFGIGYGLVVWFFGTIFLGFIMESLCSRFRRTN